MKRARVIVGLVVFASMIGAAASGCGGKVERAVQTQKPLMTDKPLFERLGGLEAIKAVVDELVAIIAADPAIQARFAAADMPSFKQKLADQICQATGGPCAYTGKSMAEAHAGMKISDAELDALMVDLGKALAKLRVPEREQGELMALLGAMRGDIVGK